MDRAFVGQSLTGHSSFTDSSSHGMGEEVVRQFDMSNAEGCNIEELSALQKMTPFQRQDYCSNMFKSLEVSIVDLPQFALTWEHHLTSDIVEEVRSSFLQHATVTMKIHVNFDDDKERFFVYGPRFDWTGVLQMFPIHRVQLEELNRDDWALFNVRLDIGTLSRLLCQWHIRAQPNAASPMGMVWKVAMDVPNVEDAEHESLVMNVLGLVYEQTISFVDKKRGLTLTDLDQIAETLKIKPLKPQSPADESLISEVFDLGHSTTFNDWA